MNEPLILVLVTILAVCFVIDPTPTIADDMTDKTIESYKYNSVSLDNNNNDNDNDNYKNTQKKNLHVNHFCLKCNSHSLFFEGLDISKGKRIQLIECNDCNFEWQETWTLPNWFWLKSSAPENYWTSERWNVQ
jgi:DNA-directed RNA polymerase subunit M/transcription elongation factor TFIIS